MVDFPDSTQHRRTEDLFREKLEEAKRRYTGDRSEQNRVQFRSALKVFTDLVMRGKVP